MMRALGIVAALLVSAALGVGSAWVVLDNGQLLGQTKHDYWFGNRNAGSSAADPYTRGIVAKIGLLALNRSETIYFHRYRNENGEQLREGCVYELSGGDLPTRWWSITVYAGDDFLPVNGSGAHSVDATQMQRDGEAWTVRLAGDRAEAANWISTRNAGEFNLALRMYNPNQSARDDEATIPFPSIRTVSCDGGGA
ncbi:MAG: DUF1214 domain-containing protein [Hyphomonadaceae bacterium]